MHAVTGADKQFRLVEWTQHHGEFGTADSSTNIAGIVGVKDRDHVCDIVVPAPAHRGPKPVGPVHCILGVDPDARFLHLVASDIGQEGTLKRVGQGKVDVVISGLDAEGGLHQPAGERPVEGSRRIRTHHHAIVVLMKLVTLGRVGQKVGEVIEQIEFAFDNIGVRLPRSGAVGFGHSCGEREPVGVAAVGRVFLTEQPDLSGRDRPLRHLVRRIPFVRIRHAGDGEPVLRRALAVAHQAVDLAHIVGIDPRSVVRAGLARKQQRAVTHFGRPHAEIVLIAEAADGRFRDVFVDAVD